MVNPFEKLLVVKRQREDAAVRTLTEREGEVQQCQRQCEQRTRTLETYIERAQDEGERLESELYGARTTKAGIEDHRRAIATMRAREGELAEALDAAHRAHDEATERLEEARTQRVKAHATVVKYETSAQAAALEVKAEEERFEETEMEESASAQFAQGTRTP